jgi:ABC-type sugar transport system substrate-binding protein
MTGSFALRLGGAALALALAGCSGPPWVTARSPDTVVLLWYPHQTPMFFASEEAAQAHCAAFGKAAVLVAEEEAPATQRAQYECR